jgi:hypothetical protein
LEKYFTWLLRDQCKICKAGSHVILSAEVKLESGDDSTLHEVQAIEISAPVLSEDTAPRVVEVEQSRHERVRSLDALEVLRAAHMSEDDIQRLLDDSTSLEVLLQIRFKSKRLRKPIAAASANRLLRNLSEDDVTLIGPAGKQKAGRLVRLTHLAQVLKIGTLIDPRDAARALNEAYSYFVSNGYIDA